MKRYEILVVLALMFIALIVPNVNAAEICNTCHGTYYDAINAKQHDNSDACTYCHKGGYSGILHAEALPDTDIYIGYIVNESTCNQPACHSNTSGSAQRPVYENHTSGGADCTQCHFANTTKIFPLSTLYPYYSHDHNFTVEYNSYNYNISGMPLKSNNGAGKGMFPYYTCTLTCHDRSGVQKIDEAANSWNQSAHARSLHMSGDDKQSCAKCKSPVNYNASANQNSLIEQAAWQGIQCRVCHSIHDRKLSKPIGGDPLAYYNATASSLAGKPVYEAVHNATELCEKCHTGTSHDSKFGGTHKDNGFDCASCHLNMTFNQNETHLFEVKNTTSGVEGCEVCHKAEDHTFQFTSRHTGQVTCEACHDKTVSRNATGYAMSSDNNYGLYNDSGVISSYKVSHGSPVTWPLHNLSKAVSCDKCHGTKSNITGQQIAPGGAPTGICAGCHPSYDTALNNSKHNGTLNVGAPDCTDCHVGYLPVNNHISGTNNTIVNKTTCYNCHENGTAMMNNPERHRSTSDCTQCHFANTTKPFSLNSSRYTNDHNLTIERNFYQYNLSGLGDPLAGMPLTSNGGVGLGMFPYYSCTMASCHSHSNLKIENASQTWVQSAHARSLHMSGDNKMSCAKCKSPANYNASANQSSLIAQADWQGIQCRVCHNLHNRSFSTGAGPLAFYNATQSSLAGYAIYEPVGNATVLCEKCHNGDSHDSKYGGTHKDVKKMDCADCHLNTTSGARFNYQSHMFEVTNLTSGATGCEVCHNSTSVHSGNFSEYWVHKDKATCEACHDKTVARNATGYAVGLNSKAAVGYGLYVDPATSEVSSWKDSHGAPATWPLHNISKAVSCDKCHDTYSLFNGTVKQDTLIAPALGNETGCARCHSLYVIAVNSSMHNQTKNASAPACTGCHTGYNVTHSGYIVNESNTCRNCHVDGNNGFYEEHTGNASKPADCTQCHFANTTKGFSLNASLYTHDHNLTVEQNFYNYNISGMPLGTNGGVGKGMFPYYTCTLTCHNGTGQSKTENETSSWLQSAHARSLHMSGDDKQSCAKCKSPANFNASANQNSLIAAADWQGIQCRVCHNMHNVSYSNSTGGKPLAYYNSTASSLAGYQVYETVPNATVLCEKCHTGGSHDSKYGGYHKDTLGFDCANCHANSTFNNATHLFEVKNTTSGATSCEVCHDATLAHSNFSEFSMHGFVTCEACHDKTVARNSSNFVVNVSVGMDAGIYKDTSTNEWTTYKVSHGSPATWPLHNISKSIVCSKCHGARSVYSGGIAPNLTSGGNSYYTTDTLVAGYNFVLLLLNPNPTLYAGNLMYTSPTGIPGVTKVLKWDSANQTWVSYEYIMPSSGVGFYYGTNSTMDGYKAYFIRGNATTAGKIYTFVGIK